MTEQLESLLAQVRALPDTDVDADLWQVKNCKQIMLPFYEHLLQVLDAELCQRLAACDLTGDALAVYRRINAGGHPVRDYLILKANNLA